jgi:hypothetical protein
MHWKSKCKYRFFLHISCNLHSNLKSVHIAVDISATLQRLYNLNLNIHATSTSTSTLKFWESDVSVSSSLHLMMMQLCNDLHPSMHPFYMHHRWTAWVVEHPILMTSIFNMHPRITHQTVSISGNLINLILADTRSNIHRKWLWEVPFKIHRHTITIG